MSEAILASVRSGSVEACTNLLLLERCALEVNRLGPSGSAPLHVAVWRGDLALARALVHGGADVDLADAESGWTALHRALYWGQLPCAALLLSRGARLTARDHRGRTPLDLATHLLTRAAVERERRFGLQSKGTEWSKESHLLVGSSPPLGSGLGARPWRSRAPSTPPTVLVAEVDSDVGPGSARAAPSCVPHWRPPLPPPDSSLRVLSAGLGFFLGLDDQGRVHRWRSVGAAGAGNKWQREHLGEGERRCVVECLTAGGGEEDEEDEGLEEEEMEGDVVSPPVAYQLFASVSIRAISSGRKHALLLSRCCQIFGLGSNRHGQLGCADSSAALGRRGGSPAQLDIFDLRRSLRVIPLPRGARARAVAAGGAHSVALDSQGGAYTWGGNAHGQLGRASPGGLADAEVSCPAPRAPEGSLPGSRRWAAASAGEQHTLLLSCEGEVWTFGCGEASAKKVPLLWSEDGDGEIDGSSDHESGLAPLLPGAAPRPAARPSPGRAAAVAAGGLLSVALTPRGRALTWPSAHPAQVRAVLGGLRGCRAVSVGAGRSLCAAAAADGTVWCWDAAALEAPETCRGREGCLGPSSQGSSNPPSAAAPLGRSPHASSSGLVAHHLDPGSPAWPRSSSPRDASGLRCLERFARSRAARARALRPAPVPGLRAVEAVCVGHGALVCLQTGAGLALEAAAPEEEAGGPAEWLGLPCDTLSSASSSDDQDALSDYGHQLASPPAAEGRERGPELAGSARPPCASSAALRAALGAPCERDAASAPSLQLLCERAAARLVLGVPGALEALDWADVRGATVLWGAAAWAAAGSLDAVLCEPGARARLGALSERSLGLMGALWQEWQRGEGSGGSSVDWRPSRWQAQEIPLSLPARPPPCSARMSALQEGLEARLRAMPLLEGRLDVQQRALAALRAVAAAAAGLARSGADVEAVEALSALVEDQAEGGGSRAGARSKGKAPKEAEGAAVKARSDGSSIFRVGPPPKAVRAQAVFSKDPSTWRNGVLSAEPQPPSSPSASSERTIAIPRPVRPPSASGLWTGSPVFSGRSPLGRSPPPGPASLPQGSEPLGRSPLGGASSEPLGRSPLGGTGSEPLGRSPLGGAGSEPQRSSAAAARSPAVSADRPGRHVVGFAAPAGRPSGGGAEPAGRPPGSGAEPAATPSKAGRAGGKVPRQRKGELSLFLRGDLDTDRAQKAVGEAPWGRSPAAPAAPGWGGGGPGANPALSPSVSTSRPASRGSQGASQQARQASRPVAVSVPDSVPRASLADYMVLGRGGAPAPLQAPRGRPPPPPPPAWGGAARRPEAGPAVSLADIQLEQEAALAGSARRLRAGMGQEGRPSAWFMPELRAPKAMADIQAEERAKAELERVYGAGNVRVVGAWG